MSEYEHTEHLLDEIQRLREENYQLRVDAHVSYIKTISDLNQDKAELLKRINRLEEELMDTKNKHSVLVADVVLDEDRADRIKRLEEALYKIEFYAATGILQDSFDEIKRIAKEAKL